MSATHKTNEIEVCKICHKKIVIEAPPSWGFCCCKEEIIWNTDKYEFDIYHKDFNEDSLFKCDECSEIMAWEKSDASANSWEVPLCSQDCYNDYYNEEDEESESESETEVWCCSYAEEKERNPIMWYGVGGDIKNTCLICYTDKYYFETDTNPKNKEKIGQIKQAIKNCEEGT